MAFLMAEAIATLAHPHQQIYITNPRAGCTMELFAKVGGDVVGAACIIELKFLRGRAKLGAVPFTTLIDYDE